MTALVIFAGIALTAIVFCVAFISLCWRLACAFDEGDR